MFHQIEQIFIEIANYGVLGLEFVGLCIILYTGARCVHMMLTKNPHVRLTLAEGIATALEFKLGGEVLRTTVARDLTELGIVGAIIVLRCVMTLLIHWEIKVEETRLHIGSKS